VIYHHYGLEEIRNSVKGKQSMKEVLYWFGISLVFLVFVGGGAIFGLVMAEGATSEISIFVGAVIGFLLAALVILAIWWAFFKR
jgi:cytochrome b subunit of formate dehydrogenase